MENVEVQRRPSENQEIKRSTSKLYSLDAILDQERRTARKTKIICTIGPSCWSVEMLVKLLDAGMNIARLNFSHGDHEGHKQVLDRLREAFKQRKNLTCAVMLDTKGPEIRTGFFKDGKKSISLKAGQKLEITQDYEFKGDENKIACSYQGLNKSVKIGGDILIADGSLVCVVTEILENGIMCEVKNDVSMGERKNMNLPGCKIDIPTITEKDEDDIVNFGVKHGVNMIALSFARTAADIENCRDILGPRGSGIKIIAKIENQEGMENYESILKTTDAIMVARGDLGMEIPPQKVFVAQKWMIKKANNFGVPIITATQMMESMINNPRPTRAEASDVANAVLDGTDAVMLSGETANGSFPLECIEVMGQICEEAEDCFDNAEQYINRFSQAIKDGITLNEIESLCCSAVKMSFEIKAKLIIVFTVGGRTAMTVAKYRPYCDIFAVSFEEATIKGLTLVRGVQSLRVPSFQDSNDLINLAINHGKDSGIVKKGDRVIIMTGHDNSHMNDSLTTKLIE